MLKSMCYQRINMTITIQPDSQQIVEDQMKSGRFASPEEVIQAGLNLLQQRQANLARLREQVALGLEQARRGELLDGEEVFDEIFCSIEGAAKTR